MPSENLSLRHAFAHLDTVERLRLYRSLWKKASRFEVLTDFPLQLDIELSALCNLKCRGCFQDGLLQGPLGLMDYDLFTKVVDEGAQKGLCCIKLQIRGESFLHPRLFDAIRYARDARIIDLQITTNATLLNDETAEQVLDSGLGGIVFSIDDRHLASYEGRRSGSQNEGQIEEAVRNFLQLRQRRKALRPWVRLVVSIPETSEAIREEKKNRIRRRYPEADIVIVNRIHDFRDDHDAYPDLHIHYRQEPCHYPMQRLAVFWNGKVTTCPCDYNNRSDIGDATRTSIESIWMSEKMVRFREQHINGKRGTMPICRHCHACIQRVSGVNLIDESPRHMADC